MTTKNKIIKTWHASKNKEYAKTLRESCNTKARAQRSDAGKKRSK
jgi:hypothetical protein